MEKPETAFAKSVSGCKHTLIYVFRNVAKGRFCMLSFYLSFVSSPLHSPSDGVSRRFVRQKGRFADVSSACAGNMLPNMFSPCRSPFAATPRQKKTHPKEKDTERLPGCRKPGLPATGERQGCSTPLENRPARCLPRARTGQARSTREAHTEHARRRLRTSRKHADVNQRHKESTCIGKGRGTFATIRTENRKGRASRYRATQPININHQQFKSNAAAASNRAVKALQRDTGRGSGRTIRACTPCSGCRQSPPVRPAQAWHTPGRAAGR